ncbi:hypothetical protein EYR36_007677 [Pleurotus pulmonarius]|nr:hypothetical protein EYR36_007677 [Pleurotus pulmonarius]
MEGLEPGPSKNPESPSSPSPSRPYNATTFSTVSPAQGVRKSTMTTDPPDRMPDRGSPGKRSVRVVVNEPRRPVHPLATDPARRTRMPSGSSGFTSHTSGTSSLGAFSDEYDLAHEDPQILHDVQKAMRLKARREARIKSGRPAHLPRTSPTPPDISSPPRQTPYQPPAVSSPQQPAVITNSEVDFGPSIAANAVPAVLHPVPSSMDHGATLDWGAGADISDEEREKVDKRWSLSLSKRKGKEKVDNSASSDSGKGDEAYKRKISKIKGKVNQSTLKKADITSHQLERKYKLVYDRLEGDRVNPLNISRWWLSRDSNTKDALDREEPLTWLKHLDRQRTPKDKQRFSWHLSALVMEEFFRAQRYPPFMETILEDPSSPQYSEKPMPFVPGGTLGLPTVDGIAGSARNSLDVGSRRSGESIYSAVSSAGNPPPSISPTTSLSHLRGMSTRRQRLNAGGEDGPSAPPSLSEGSDDERKGRPIPRAKRRPEDLHIVSARFEPASNQRSTASKEPSEDDDGPSPSTAVVGYRIVPGVIPYTGAEPPGLVATRMETTVPPPRPQHSAASSQQIRIEQESEKDKQRLDQEYELKLRLLDDLNAQNTRIRQTLNRVANTVREQDALHASFTAMLDVPHVGMPQDVLDAFGHDPSAVTGSTRRLRGWEAVEDIHSRVLRQRDALRRFIYSVEEKTPGPMKSVLDHPIASLTRALENITAQHEEITLKAQEVAKVLQSVKSLHADVKAEYNETLAQTSVVYPELSYIVALEESYKDQYQQVWEFGMDALTFLLDNVTPFWRTYGKTLGVDIQDFLIIPLYRNEFTGEAKRYPIKHIPRRSFRHWLGFLIFFVLTSAICFLQCRAAITSSRNYRLQIIAHSGFRWLLVPFVWVSIVIQWSAFLVELCMLIVQVAVTAWWLGWILRIFD